MIPSFLLLSRCAQLNTRRLWNADGTVHAAFQALSTFLLRRSIAVACIQETHAPDFAGLPDDQPYRYDGSSSVGGSEAGFLFHESVTTATIPGLPDAQRIRWRLVGGLLCVCSYYALHGGMDAHFRTRFWEELVASVRHTQRTLPGIPIFLSGDANAWWLAFHLGRQRHRDRPVFPYIHELLEGCGLCLWIDLTRATHTLLQQLSIWSSRLRSLLLPSALLPPFGSHIPPQILEILARRRRPLAHAGPQGLRESYPQMLPTARLLPRTPCLNAVHRLSALREHVTIGGRTSRPSPRLEDTTTSPRTSLDQSQEGSLTSLLTFRQAPSMPFFQRQSSPML